MPKGNRQELEQAVAALEAQHGAGIVRRAKDIVLKVPHISTGFPLLDTLTGCGGFPLGEMTLLSGVYTSGKLTIAYKTLVEAQKLYPRQDMAIVTLHGDADADYLKRAGANLERVAFADPAVGNAANLLVDLARLRKTRLIIVNSLADLQKDRTVYRQLKATLGVLRHTLQATQTALIWIDDPSAPWLRIFRLDDSNLVRQFSLVHVEVQLEELLYDRNGEMVGYTSSAKLHKSRWSRGGRTVPVSIEFNGTIKVREEW